MNLIKYLNLILVLFLTACSYKQKTEGNHSVDTFITKKEVQGKKNKHYTNQQLEIFLDSIGKLSSSLWTDHITHRTDSTFQNQTRMNSKISKTDFELLKKACKKNEIGYDLGKRIFNDPIIDSLQIISEGFSIKFFSFDKHKNDFNEFAISLDKDDKASILYFFSSNKIISKHIVHHRYGLELKHYENSDSKTVIYYKENFVSGTGVTWFNYFFYTYDYDKLVPVLTVPQKIYQDGTWSNRIVDIKSTIEKTHPLTLKMVYSQYLLDSLSNPLQIVKDSSLIQYIGDNKSKQLKGNYRNSKINYYQIISYYLEDNEVLFINTYYQNLKKYLKSKSIAKQKLALNYLSEVKNNCNRK